MVGFSTGVAGAVRSWVWECFLRTVFPHYPLENILNMWKFGYQSLPTRKSLALNDDGAAGDWLRGDLRERTTCQSNLIKEKKKRPPSR